MMDRSELLPIVKISQTLYGNSAYAQRRGLVIRGFPLRRPGKQNPTIALIGVALSLTGCGMSVSQRPQW